MCSDEQGEAAVHWSRNYGGSSSLKKQANPIFRKPGKPYVKVLDWETADVVSIATSVLVFLPEFEQVSKSFSASVHNGVKIFSSFSVGHCYPDIVLMDTIGTIHHILKICSDR